MKKSPEGLHNFDVTYLHTDTDIYIYIYIYIYVGSVEKAGLRIPSTFLAT